MRFKIKKIPRILLDIIKKYVTGKKAVNLIKKTIIRNELSLVYVLNY